VCAKIHKALFPGYREFHGVVQQLAGEKVSFLIEMAFEVYHSITGRH